jgi:hypothetical protein
MSEILYFLKLAIFYPVRLLFRCIFYLAEKSLLLKSLSWEHQREFSMLLSTTESIPFRRINKEVSKILVKKEFSNKISVPFSVVDTLEKRWGWVFNIASDEYLKSGDSDYNLIGIGCVIVNKNSSSVLIFESSLPPNNAVCLYENSIAFMVSKITLNPFTYFYRKHRLIKTDYGRSCGWYIEKDGEVISELNDCQYEDMFWQSYRLDIVTNSPDLRDKIMTNEFWQNFEELVFRNREFGDIVDSCFPAVSQSFINPVRIRMRALYIID